MDELLLLFGSVVVVVTDAVLVTCVPLLTLALTLATTVMVSEWPLGKFALTLAVMVMVSEWPLGKVAMVSVTWLPLLLSVKVSEPAVWACVTKVSVLGNRSESDTLWASLGPLLVITIV